MEVRTRDPGGSVDRIYGTIAKAASKNKFLDFRNALTLAFLEDMPICRESAAVNMLRRAASSS